MSGNNGHENINFIDFIENNKIVIPLIQREYAQGRNDTHGEEIRKNFVPELIKVLTGEKGSLELDFVFGVKEDGKFIPLDGQQRLTTLFLLHWYCWIHKGNWSFTYESRRMANSFVNGLLTEEKKYDKSSEPSVWIKSRDWFFENWLADPTVSGMLTMLDEIHKNAKNKDCKPDNLNNITFYLYPIKELDADNAYTKMNARGEPLTAWENLKALLDKKEQDLCLADKLLSCDHPNCCLTNKTVSCKQSNCCLFQWIENIDGNWLFTLEQYAELNYQNYESILKDLNNLKAMGDNEQNKKAFEEKEKAFEETLDGDVKKINCAFRNIFDLAVCIDLAKQINEPPSNEDKNNEKISSIQNKISSFHEHKTLLSDYAECVNRRIFDIATDLFQTLLLFDSSDLKKLWDENFWESKERKSFTDAFLFNEKYSFVDCVRFYSICRFGKELTRDWLRIIRNILENGPEIGKNNFADAISLIEELSGHPKGILTFLAAKENDIQSTFATEQVTEEREKARQIIEPARNCCGPDYRKIQEAESTAFFKGAIRFLYHNENGEVNWSQFNQKFENAKQYFDENGVRQSYKDNAILLRRFLSHMNSWEQWWQLKYDSTKDNWHDILLNKNLMAPVHKLLIQNDSTQFNFESYKSIFHNDERKRFLTEFLIQEQVLKELPAGWKLVWRQSWDGGEGRGVYDLDPQTRGSHPYFIIHPRIKLLADEEIVLVNIERNGYYIPGVDIEFQYNECNFRWLITRNSNEYEVYLLDEENNYAKRCNPQGDSEEDMYYCVNIFKSYFDFEQEKFKHALETLIKACKDED